MYHSIVILLYRNNNKLSNICYVFLHYLYNCVIVTHIIVTVTVKNRVVTVKGPRGTLKRDFTHFPIDLHLSQGVCIIYINSYL